MDSAQKLLCEELGEDDDYQSVLNVQKRRGAPYRAVKNEHIQLLHDGSMLAKLETSNRQLN